MAGVATEAFMNSHGSVIVTGLDLPRGFRRMALVAQCLALVAADLHVPFSLAHGGQGQIGQSDGLQFPPVK
jgi:hypothetical protein